MTDATVLGIQPPHTVRIEYDDSYQDWPFECVNVQGDRIEIAVTTWHSVDVFFGGPRIPREFPPVKRQTVLHYPYEHAQQLEDGCWRFLGGDHPEFYVRPGPPQPTPTDTAGPQQ